MTRYRIRLDLTEHETGDSLTHEIDSDDFAFAIKEICSSADKWIAGGAHYVLAKTVLSICGDDEADQFVQAAEDFVSARDALVARIKAQVEES